MIDSIHLLADALRHPFQYPFLFLLTLTLLIFAVISGVELIGAVTVSEATITVEERVGAHGGGGAYLILTEGGEVFTVEDNLFLLKFDASDRYAALKEGGRYHVTCTGWRVQPLSWYRNIVAAEEV